MLEFNALKVEIAAPPDKPARKPWSPPRVIESDARSTEASIVNLPEANSGLLSS